MDEKNRSNLVLFSVLMGAAAMVGSIVYFSTHTSTKTELLFLSNFVAESDYNVPPLERDYQNEQFRFSLKLPEGFTASELPFDGTGIPIVLQDAAGNGIQIYVRDVEGDPHDLTEKDIRTSIPDMKMEHMQVVEIGESNKGVAFMSDSSDFGGASREVWFYFGGHLYQVSTYARLDNLLQAMFSSWQFY